MHVRPLEAPALPNPEALTTIYPATQCPPDLSTCPLLVVGFTYKISENGHNPTFDTGNP